MIDVKINTQALERLKKKTANNIINKSIVDAINTTMTSVRTRVQKKATAELGLKRKDITKRLRVTKATMAKPESKLQVSDRGLPLSAFSPRKQFVQTRRGRRTGVSIQVGASRQLVKC